MKIVHKTNNKNITKLVEHAIYATCFENSNIIIKNGSRLNKVYLYIDGKNFCIRAWNISDIGNSKLEILYTLFKLGAYGTEIANDKVVIDCNENDNSGTKIYRSNLHNREYKHEVYEKAILNPDRKIDTIPSEFRTVDVYIRALSVSKTLEEKNHIIAIMDEDINIYTESQHHNRTITLRKLQEILPEYKKKEDKNAMAD